MSVHNEVVGSAVSAISSVTVTPEGIAASLFDKTAELCSDLFVVGKCYF